jgi:DNA-binding MarR family transcriptional regulator
LRVLTLEGTLHPAEIGERLQIAKAQMTHLIDKLVELGLVEREIDSVDRRTLNIGLTVRGREIMEENEICLVRAVEENMASLADNELEALSSSLHNMRDTLLKLL